MKKVIFIMGIAILSLCATACKTQNKAESINNSSTTTSELTEKYWKLIELFGNPIVAENNANEAHIIFKAEGDQFNGSTGCNRFSGTYQIEKPDRITFSQAVSTRMMCLNMDTENRFLEVINTANSYVVRNDTLSLNRARMAPLARFVAVYL